MSYFKECPHCGSHLDPNEKCNCEKPNVNNIIDLNPIFDSDSIILKKGEVYLQTAKEVSDYLKDLPLTKEQNDKLVALMVEHVGQARQDTHLCKDSKWDKTFNNTVIYFTEVMKMSAQNTSKNKKEPTVAPVNSTNENIRINHTAENNNCQGFYGWVDLENVILDVTYVSDLLFVISDSGCEGAASSKKLAGGVHVAWAALCRAIEELENIKEIWRNED